jgi:hypothetical protein
LDARSVRSLIAYHPFPLAKASGGPGFPRQNLKRFSDFAAMLARSDLKRQAHPKRLLPSLPLRVNRTNRINVKTH